jgi:pimeloyl-ACP methyl ester carboxylesterase
VVLQRRIEIGSMDVFYREAGKRSAPVVLLPHGYPCSSFQFRHLMPLLAERWRLIAPDFPGCGYSSTPNDFCYDIDGYVDFLECFIAQLGVRRYALYLHDFSVHIGLRLAIRYPQRVAALIVQNGDIYGHQFAPQFHGHNAGVINIEDSGSHYRPQGSYWCPPSSTGRAKIEEVVSEHRFQRQFLDEVSPRLAERIPPDLWKLHWSLMTPQRCEIACHLIPALEKQAAWLPRYRTYLHAHRPETLILWGRHDACIPERAAHTYLRDLPRAELHVLDGGHWLLETHVDSVAALLGNFLGRAGMS